jgi:hypothetical protein
MIYIIDPASTEWNRGSFCYLPYLFYECLQYEYFYKEGVTFLENYTIQDIDKVSTDENDFIYVALWSPTQKDACLELHRTRPNAKFFGYYGFIEQLGLPIKRITNEEILSGMKHQGRSFKEFRKVLLSDCDSHLQGKYKGQWYPFHTSYGCVRKCSFCPSSKNTIGTLTSLSLGDVYDKLDRFYNYEYSNIHFTDEDLFMNTNRAMRILEYAKNLKVFNFIALCHSFSISKFIDKFGVNFLRESGIRLLEIGFEGGPLLKDKGGEQHISQCLALYHKCKDLVYWLTMTFSPGETIQTLNETGEFLKKYGRNPEELVPRLRTNGTEGGLGQFFQPYPNLQQNLKGIFSPFNHIRLFPSYIPQSFLNSKICEVNLERVDEWREWCFLYGIYPIVLEEMKASRGKCISELIKTDKFILQAELCIILAIAARLEIIK